MKIIYAQQEYPTAIDLVQPLFLVGPTPRSEFVPSWRPSALEILETLGFEGEVIVPEPGDGDFYLNYDNQIDWEDEGLKKCVKYGSIAAWVPRCLKTMPAFTTNVEFGLHLCSGKLVYGRPYNAPKTAYLDHMYRKRTGREPCDNLESLLKEAVELGNERK